MTATLLPIFRAPGEGEVVTERPERTLRILGELDDVIISWFRYEPGEEGPEPHVHHHHTDAFYVLEGELEVGLGPEVERVAGGPGSTFAAPPNTVHTFRNVSEATAIFLNVHAPSAGFGDLLRGIDGGRFDQHDPPPDGGRPLEDAVVHIGDAGERTERANGTRVIKAELPQLSIIELMFLPGWEGVDAHMHGDHTDSFFVLEGTVSFIRGDDVTDAGPGSFITAPRNSIHGFRNDTDAPVRVVNLHAPDAGFVARLRA